MGRRPRRAGVFEVNPDSLPVHQIHLVEQQADFSELKWIRISGQRFKLCADHKSEKK